MRIRQAIKIFKLHNQRFVNGSWTRKLDKDNFITWEFANLMLISYNNNTRQGRAAHKIMRYFSKRDLKVKEFVKKFMSSKVSIKRRKLT